MQIDYGNGQSEKANSPRAKRLESQAESPLLENYRSWKSITENLRMRPELAFPILAISPEISPKAEQKVGQCVAPTSRGSEKIGFSLLRIQFMWTFSDQRLWQSHVG
jgi:hypothetical protein